MRISNIITKIVLAFTFFFSSIPMVWAHHNHHVVRHVLTHVRYQPQSTYHANWSPGYSLPYLTPSTYKETGYYPYYNQTVYHSEPSPEVIDIETTHSNSTLLSVKVPNQYGELTSVYLKRIPGGFKGSHGEIYNQFPSVSDLKPLYGQ